MHHLFIFLCAVFLLLLLLLLIFSGSYGIGWCPYSRKQQQMFGDQLKDVNFVDCGVKDSNEMNEFCQSKGIRGFPSWEFEGNRIVPGFQPYERLRLLAGCVEKKKK